MQSAAQTVPVSNNTLWAGRIMSTLAVLFMLLDGVLKLFNPPPVVESMTQLGYAESLAIGIGIIEIICLAVYMVPRTSVLGAILLTGYLGGAIASHVRIGSPLFSLVFPVILGLLLWGGLYLRDEQLRKLIPLRS
jgi:hypothetical protein